MRRLLFTLLMAFLAGCATLVWLSRHSFRRAPQSIEVGLRGEALENPTLLLQKWLEAEGRLVQRKGGEVVAPELPEGAVVLLLHLSQPLTQTEVDTLLAWVRRGGHLLTDGTAAPFNDDRGLALLHQTLGVTLQNKQAGEPNLTEAKQQEDTDTFHDGEQPYRVRRTARWRLVPEDAKAWSYSLGDKGLEVLLTRVEGKGRITLTPDLNFVYRDSLGQLDHAAYVQRLLALQSGCAPVVIWSRPVELSLFSWVWEHARAPLLALLALVGAWVWKGWPRFGPMLPEAKPQRRSLLEHLSASARLLWHGGAAPHLVACTREALERRAQRLNPAYESMDLGARAAWLAQTAGGNADAIGAALDARPGRSSHQLAQDLLTLERLRQRL
ncbi:DUF4350 domain-containing protein [Geothrix sp. PMB-07]|uniref:DUF4350 domain-containing protein n=1 Tax=Geothrix sp. PMB-07 TaxID=3068640 RepID=UPI0027412EFE|nr:DUF4350 domain-containing protein [Geothrix sp. PMB-07]WLT31943.1 DUF4350 domain-containing protein [Geothrix sp. PMB-07]